MSRLEAAFARIDAFNDGDPARVGDGGDGGEEVGGEVLYGRRMSAWLARLAPDASEALQIACRAQHIGRWRIRRRDYPEGRAGYKRWRSDLARLHAETASGIVREVGYDDAVAERVSALVRKQKLRTDPEAQTLEDVACLVFLEHYFADFAAGRDDDHIVDIVAKTWAKMSEAGHAAALTIALPERLGARVERALAPKRAHGAAGMLG